MVPRQELIISILLPKMSSVFTLGHQLNPSRPGPGQREKLSLKFLFSHFFVVPQNIYEGL